MGPVTAEVASSSLVVPAILSKRVVPISLKPSRLQKGAVLHPFCTRFLVITVVFICSASQLVRLAHHNGVRLEGDDQTEHGSLSGMLSWRDGLCVDIQRGSSLPQPRNRPNLINDNVKFVEPRAHRSGQRLNPNRVGREEDRGAALNPSFFFRLLLLTTSRKGVFFTWIPVGGENSYAG